MRTSILPALCAGALCAIFSAPASALTSGEYDVSNATSTHGLYLNGNAGLGNYFPILDGSFTVDADAGLAILEMTTGSTSIAGGGFEVSVVFEYLCSGASVGQEGCDDFTLPQIDGHVNTTLADQQSWEFWLIESGTLTGLGTLDGLLLSVNTRPDDGSKPFRYGDGANWFDWDFGASGWFNFVVEMNNTQYDVRDLNGDFNLDLTPVPLPAGVWLLLSGLVGLAARRRK